MALCHAFPGVDPNVIGRQHVHHLGRGDGRNDGGCAFHHLLAMFPRSLSSRGGVDFGAGSSLDNACSSLSNTQHEEAMVGGRDWLDTDMKIAST